jgi:hypothetical protein
VNQRISGITLTAVPVKNGIFGCGQESKAEPDDLVFLYGTRDGTGCSVGNVDYFKQLRLNIPEDKE